MTKLKTLKDFESKKFTAFIHNCFKCGDVHIPKNEVHAIQEHDYMLYLELKQEAIKWYKHWEPAVNGEAPRAFIKHFFNLTEEELE